MTTEQDAHDAAVVERVMHAIAMDVDECNDAAEAFASPAEFAACVERTNTALVAELEAAAAQGRREALEQATEQDCHLFKCGAAAILAAEAEAARVAASARAEASRMEEQGG